MVSSRQWIEKTGEGWRWRDLAGNWIAYDAQGQATGYGDRKGTQVRFVLDAEGRRGEVRDRQDQLVMRFRYQDGRLIEARDRSDRVVRYTYQGDRLTAVTDAAGQV